MMNFTLDFMVIGSRKTGTTWLYENMLSHPDICISSSVKESSFFCSQFERGLDWYKDLFPELQPGQKRGEIDTNLIGRAGSAEKLHATFPETKIIAIFRNPADLFYSSYMQATRKMKIDYTIDDAWNRNAFHGEVFFHKLLEPYLKLFRKDQFLFLLYEDMSKDQEAFLREIYQFIGVGEILDPEKVKARVNVARSSRMPRLSRLMTDLAQRALKMDMYWLYKGVKSLGIQKLLEKPLTAKVPLKLDGVLRDRIMTDTAEDVARLEDVTGLNLAARWQ